MQGKYSNGWKTQVIYKYTDDFNPESRFYNLFNSVDNLSGQTIMS